MSIDKSSSIKLPVESTIADEIEGENPESRFECPICISWLINPVLTSCGHKFCSECIYNWLQKKSACCPVDSKPLDPDKDLFPDLFTSREISQQRMKCPHQEFGCDVELSPVDIDKHLKDCKFKRVKMSKSQVDCLFRGVGCEEVFQLEEDMQKHVQGNNYKHLMMMVKTLSDIRSSNSETNCKFLDSSHWDAPPKNGENNQQSQQLLKNLYERIVTLEQQNRELSITVSNLNTKLAKLHTSMRFNDEELSSRYCNGHYIWRLKKFSEKLGNMLAGPGTMFYSPGFYTEPSGYKICSRINLSKKDPSFLSVVLHMMQSDNDDALEWPFDGILVFTLVHPEDGSKSIREETTSQPDLEAFQKPQGELNKRSFGYTEFVSVHELNNFIRDDCLIFKIEVKANGRSHSYHSDIF